MAALVKNDEQKNAFVPQKMHYPRQRMSPVGHLLGASAVVTAAAEKSYFVVAVVLAQLNPVGLP